MPTNDSQDSGEFTRSWGAGNNDAKPTISRPTAGLTMPRSLLDEDIAEVKEMLEDQPSKGRSTTRLSASSISEDPEVRKILEELHAYEMEETRRTTAPLVPPPSLHNELDSKDILDDIASYEAESARRATAPLVWPATGATQPLNPEAIQAPPPSKVKPLVNVYLGSSSEVETPRRSMATVVLIGSFSLLLAIAGLIYREFVASRTDLANSAPDATQVATGQSIRTDQAGEAAIELVRQNRATKIPGSTISQALTDYLNDKNQKGFNCQLIGWQAQRADDTNGLYQVKFLWKEHDINKEASWQVDINTQAIKALNDEAARIRP
ncbi:MAG: hypothetical protein AB1489_16905 [Acidobacteriota bacterium]